MEDGEYSDTGGDRDGEEGGGHCRLGRAICCKNGGVRRKGRRPGRGSDECCKVQSREGEASGSD